MYVLRKDLTQRGLSPYVLERSRGDMPRSSVELYLRFKKNAEDNKDDNINGNEDENETESDNTERPVKENMYRLHDYLGVPPPRMRSIAVIKQKLAEQYPDLNIETIDTISFKINDIEMGEAEHEF
jgi:hypothetical protein